MLILMHLASRGRIDRDPEQGLAMIGSLDEHQYGV
jgi:hypothetical protein